jgi:hypothetical protein
VKKRAFDTLLHDEEDRLWANFTEAIKRPQRVPEDHNDAKGDIGGNRCWPWRSIVSRLAIFGIHSRILYCGHYWPGRRQRDSTESRNIEVDIFNLRV